MSPRISLVVPLVVAAMLALCSPAFAQYGGSATMTGAVIDAETREPLGDVCVLARAIGLAYSGDLRTRTDAQGRYTITGLTLGGTYEPRFSDCAVPSRGYVTLVKPQETFSGWYGSVTKTVNAELSKSATAGSDSDADGLADSVDTQQMVPSSAFSDGVTDGSISSAGGLAVQVSDVASPGGVRITTGPVTPASGSAYIRVCGYGVILDANTVVEVVCGSIRLNVVSGSAADIVAGDTTVTVPTGGTARVSDGDDGTTLVQNLGTETLNVAVDGVALSVAAGMSSTVVAELTVESLCALTGAYVTSGGQAAQQLAAVACGHLAQLARRPADARAESAYLGVVNALQRQSHIAASDAELLRALAQQL